MEMRCVFCEVGAEYITLQKTVSLITGLSARRPASIPVYFVWNLWWTTWHRYWLFSEYFCFPLSVADHHYSTHLRLSNTVIRKKTDEAWGPSVKAIPSIIRDIWRERFFYIVNVAKFLHSLDLSDDFF